MISGILRKGKTDPALNKDLADLFARPIKTVVEQNEVAEYETVEGIEQEGDEELSAVQIKVLFHFLQSLNLNRREMRELSSLVMLKSIWTRKNSESTLNNMERYMWLVFSENIGRKNLVQVHSS